MNLTAGNIAEICGGTLLCGDPDTVIRDIKTDSRQIVPGDLFVPIRGEKTDSHIYIESVFALGAAASFTERDEIPSGARVLIRVENGIDAIQTLAAFHRKKFSYPVIGITGSVGKTSTREMVALALSAGLTVMSTKGNQNSQIGLPLTVLRLDDGYDAAVLEMGMSEFGEMQRLCAAAQPTMAVMTNIGVTHIGQLKTQENILSEKFHITDSFGSDSVLFLNGDDPLLGSLYGKQKYQTVSYGFGETCDWRAEEIRTDGESTSFVLVHAASRRRMSLPVCGNHNVQNALAAMAVAEKLGVPAENAAAALSGYLPPAMRQQKKTVGGVTVIDDSYNASPDSVKSGIDVLCALPCSGKRIAVLADMKELGTLSQRAHFEVGSYAAQKGVGLVLAIGEDARLIAEGAERGGTESAHFLRNEDAVQALLPVLKSGDVILVKGSRSMRTDEIVQALFDHLS